MRYLSVGITELNTRQNAPQVVAENEYSIL